MTDQNKTGCCGQEANTKNEQQTTVATHSCGCGNETHGKEQTAVATAQPGETRKPKQTCCC